MTTGTNQGPKTAIPNRPQFIEHFSAEVNLYKNVTEEP
jgi:hypothetical protein